MSGLSQIIGFLSFNVEIKGSNSICFGFRFLGYYLNIFKIKGIDGKRFSNFPSKIALHVGLIPVFLRFFPFKVVLIVLQMGFNPIICCFLPRELGISMFVDATAISVSKWWDIPNSGILGKPHNI